ncbi:hypothetical protein D9757_001714 [Collybiopsis confluens]|uniref:Mitochondrial escape protein 2 n=1 Tax=Collybiopsis confluens TaxID=2823264 RepID=A0A8H5HY93_9AGAR|nr:hypothetical protein D9757_001714 [Collybiopsis confluens]
MSRRALAGLSHYHNIFRKPQIFRRSFSENVQILEREGCVFVDSMFPVLLGKFDIRRLFVNSQQESLVNNLKERFSTVTTHDMQVTNVDPHLKDGGVFVHFKYKATTQDDEIALKNIEESLKTRLKERGGITTWVGTRTPSDILGRFASSMLKVSFEGPDVPEEKLYNIFRPYGAIEELVNPTPVPAGAQRYSIVSFNRLKAATVARNVVYGLEVDSTRLRISYAYPIEAHVVREWVANHPRIILPIIFFLLGTITYAIFDPIRVFMVEARLLDWFDIKEFRLYKWLRANTLEIIYSKSEALPVDKQIWKEREDAERAIQTYLSDLPSTVTFVHGPQGSGKSTMITSALKAAERRPSFNRKSLTIDCRELSKASSDAALVSALAKQTGYWPVFSFLNSIQNLIDLASVGLIGQKAGFSRSIDEQMHQILDTVAVGLRRVSERQHHQIEKLIRARGDDKRGITEEQRQHKVANAVEGQRKDKVSANVKAVEALPIVIIRNFAGKSGSSREDLLNNLAQWAAKLAENQASRSYLSSGNQKLIMAANRLPMSSSSVTTGKTQRKSLKVIKSTLQSKPLNLVALYDADETSALAFVQEKLYEADIKGSFSPEEKGYVERLGGRSVDLESLVNKVRSGMGVKEAVEDIISRGVGELRKNAFGDDSEDAKNFPWSRDQAWTVLDLLSKTAEVPYHQVLLDHPFKGDEGPLRSMEQAELISIATQNGRPSVIRPGKPVFRWVFERLVDDPIFRATQEIEFNTRLISGAETTINSCEEELLKLAEIRRHTSPSWLGEDPSLKRVQYLMKKMMDAERKVENLEKKNIELKKTLSRLS